MNITRNLAFSIPLLALSINAHATNGYFTHGLGVINKSMAGAGTATPEEAMAIANNPASAVLLEDSTQLGIALFSPRRSYTASTSMANGNGGAFTIAPGKVDSGREYFPIPYIARTWHLQEDSAVGITAYGRGGMNTHYTSGAATFDPDGPGPAPVMTLPGPYGAGNAGVDLSQLFVEAAYSQRNGDRFSWGISGIFTAQAFEAIGVGTFAPYAKSFAASGGTAMPTDLSNNSHDYAYGFGAKVGVNWQASPQLALAISYQSDIYMGEFDKYASLFAGQGDFDIPSNIRFGASFKASDNVTLHYDIDHTNYNDIDSVGNSVRNIFSCPTAGQGGTDLESCLGGSKGAGFGWQDVTVHKFGIAWQPASRPDWTLRAGASKSSQPVESGEVLFNMLAPGVIEKHFTIGATHRMANKREYSFTLMVAPNEKVSGINSFDPTQTLRLEMRQFELEFGYSW
jgi:long-chain fatty acid transport protein